MISTEDGLGTGGRKGSARLMRKKQQNGRVQYATPSDYSMSGLSQGGIVNPPPQDPFCHASPNTGDRHS